MNVDYEAVTRGSRERPMIIGDGDPILAIDVVRLYPGNASRMVERETRSMSEPIAAEFVQSHRRTPRLAA